MQLSIREASRFVIGGEILRREAMQTSGRKISFDHVCAAALREGEDGKKLRESIETLADHEASWFRNTPPHTLKTAKVMQSREAEVKTFVAISAAVVATIEHASGAALQNSEALSKLHDAYEAAYAAIDSTPGSAVDREMLKEAFQDQTKAATPHLSDVGDALIFAERTYLEAQSESILSRYDRKLDRSADFDM